jgi:hypothetical protein
MALGTWRIGGRRGRRGRRGSTYLMGFVETTLNNKDEYIQNANDEEDEVEGYIKS